MISQALETAIGMTLIFWVLASVASAIVEAISRLLDKRSKDLESTIAAMLLGPDASPPAATGPGTEAQAKAKAKAEAAVLDTLRGTSVYGAARAAAGRGLRLTRRKVGPTYLSSTAFADAVVELLRDVQTADGPLPGWPGLQHRLRDLTADARTEVLDVKAGLERWFDATMDHLSDAYKRWATTLLFGIGLVLTLAANVSTLDTAQSLWQDPALRQVAVDAATADTSRSGTAASSVTAVQQIRQLGLPLGWHGGPPVSAGWWLSHLGGWLVTALLVMLGAPFWFDALSRLVSLNTAGTSPPPAGRDPGSATQQRAGAPVDPAAGSGAGAIDGPRAAPPDPLVTFLRQRLSPPGTALPVALPTTSERPAPEDPAPRTPGPQAQG